MKKLLVIVSVVIISFYIGCERGVDIEAEKSAILAIMTADDQALLDGVIKKETKDVLESESFNIKEGKIEKLTVAEVNRRNQTLLDRGKFKRIENLQGPYVNISPDAKMAWVVVQTKFVIAYTDSSGEEKEWEGLESRLEVYEKKARKWKSVACAQTY
jgi:hypothetical protein